MLLAAPILVVMDGFIVIVVAPSIQGQMRASDASVQLVVAARAVAYAGLLVTGGRLGDMYGQRRLLVIGLTLFSVTSLLAAAAPNQQLLVVARALQGGSAALMYPQTLALIQSHFHGPDLGRAMAAFGAVLGVASGAAQLIGGLIVQFDLLGIGWRAVFLLDSPIGIAAAILASAMVPRSMPGPASRLDLLGVTLLTSGLFALVLPMTLGREMGWPPWTWGLLAAAALVGAAFVLHERRLTARRMAPLISFDLFRVRAIAVGLVATLTLYGGQLSLWVLLTLYLQDWLRLSPLQTGLVFMPVGLGLLVGSVGTRRLPAWARSRALTIATVGLAADVSVLGALAFVRADSPDVLILLPVLLVVGIAFGVVIPTMVGTILRVIPADHEGAASGVLVTAQQVAGALGIALTGVIFFGLLHRATPYTSAFAITLGLNVALFLISALLVQTLRDEL